MAFTKTWDESDQGGQRPSTIDDLIENTRYGVRERANVEHYAYADETGYSDVWRHRKESGRINFGLAANKPATIATGMVDGAIYHETDTGLIVRYNTATALWVTIASPNHASLTITYTTGTATFTNASAVVSGVGTAWTTYVAAGDVIKGADNAFYNILSVDSVSQVTLDRVYAGSTASGQSYTIYLDSHPSYLSKGGDTVNGALTVTGVLTASAGAAMNTQKITGLLDGTAATDAATYAQVKVTAFKTGIYVGDGNATQAITGTGIDLSGAGIPWRIEINRHTASTAQFVKTNKNTGDQSFCHSATADAYTADMIKSGDADGFTVGNTNAVNTNGITYQYSIVKGQ